MPNSLVKELREVEPVSLPDRDVRAAKPLFLRGVLRFDTIRSLSRIAILAALDIGCLFLAIWTALAIKAAIQAPDTLGQMYDQAKDYAPLACLVMVLLFARSGLYRDRAQRPGFAKVIAALVEVVLVVLIYAEIEGHEFNSYYIFYGTLLLRADLRVGGALGVRARQRRGAARGRIPPPRGARRVGAEHRGRVAARCATAR